MVRTGEDRVGDDDRSSKVLLLLFWVEESESWCVSEEMGVEGWAEEEDVDGLYRGQVPYRAGVGDEVNIASRVN